MANTRSRRPRVKKGDNSNIKTDLARENESSDVTKINFTDLTNRIESLTNEIEAASRKIQERQGQVNQDVSKCISETLEKLVTMFVEEARKQNNNRQIFNKIGDIEYLVKSSINFSKESLSKEC